jgi:hypothetical protein
MRISLQVAALASGMLLKSKQAAGRSFLNEMPA